MDGWYFSTWRRLRTSGNHALVSHIHSSILLPYSLSRSHKQPCDFVCAMVVYLGTCPAAQQHPEWKYITVCINIYMSYISDYICYIYIWIYVCMVSLHRLLHELQISMEHRIHRCIAFASAFWCATPVLKSRVNSSPQSSNSHGGFIHSDFNKGKQAQNDAKWYKATTIYPYITNNMDKVHPASQWINHRPTTVSSLRGKYLSHKDMCPAAALRQLHWWLHPLSRPGLRCHRNEIAWKCLTWKSIAVGWTWI